MKTNILFLLQTLRTGGSERLVMDLCRYLDPDKFNCYVAAFIDGALHEKFEEMRIPTTVISIRSAKKDALRTMREISDYIGRNTIHVVNAHHFTPFFYSFYGARRHGCKLFYTVHSRAEIAAANMFWSFIRGVMIRFSDAAIGISQDVGDAIKKQFGIGANKVLTLANAVNYRRFMGEADRKAKRREIGLADNDIVIGCVGNLRKDKNYPNLIKAFKIIHTRMRGTKLIIVGEGKRHHDLETLIDDLGLENSTFLLGARNDIPELMRVMDIYCLCSFSEGLPLSLLEAMSAGLPIVGTDVRGIQDVVEHGKTGLLVPSDDPEKLSEALLRMIGDRELARDLSLKGREYVINEHGFDTWIARYESLFSLNGSKLPVHSKAN
ncbi:MAG: glycosyltransferase [Deltaproteobacteria bacterium]|nr:glycosyltransferase [Deltaproteobacteria bacterium]